MPDYVRCRRASLYVSIDVFLRGWSSSGGWLQYSALVDESPWFQLSAFLAATFVLERFPWFHYDVVCRL